MISIAAFVSFIVKGFVVLTFSTLIALALRRGSASSQHAVWVISFIALILVSAVSLSGLSWPEATVLPFPSITSESYLNQVVIESSSELEKIGFWLLAIWATGVGLLLAKWFQAIRSARRIVNGADIEYDRAWLSVLESACEQIGLRKNVRLLRSQKVKVPIAWGFFRPAVIIPLSSVRWDDDRRKAVLLHELAHIKRNDAWTQVLAQIAVILHWPNLLVWNAYRRYIESRERACDDVVIVAGVSSPDYAAHLVAIARELCNKENLFSAAQSVAGGGELSVRVSSILDSKRCRDHVRPRGYLIATSCMAALALPLALSPPFVASSGSNLHISEGVRVPQNTVLSSPQAEQVVMREEVAQPEVVQQEDAEPLVIRE